ncbi:transcription elongation factor GreA [Alkalispirochaeta americana]|uniref:Transcription elongation factor GreA n=2 Tax=Alkalispirochaeta americana TaxID=159291 RepID=A0A1N6P860_9SPIO|nr:transcription elongation factor GreA [Alkalispirochaeta americana]
MPMSTTSTMPDLIQQLNELLNQEKWTRATLNNYTVGNFTELDDIIEQMQQNDLEEEARALCEEHLQHTKNSIIALYIAGVLDTSRQSVNDTNLVMLTQIFLDNHKWTIVEFLCNRILEFGENRTALRILAEVYHDENQTEKLHQTWERLILIDYEEADIVRRLAELKEEAGDLEQATSYYKKALHRYITKKNFSNVKDIWHRLVVLSPNETEFFYHAETKIARQISTDRAIQLLEDLYPPMKESGDWPRAIELLKRVLGYDPKNHWARKEIIHCFEEHYSDHSNLTEYIRISNLHQSWRPVHEAIADFEKHIAFDTGNFVFHRSWGIGRIREIKGDDITIDFAKKRGHRMSLKMAVNALDVLPKEHIWVLRAVWKRDKLKNLVKKNPVWALKTVIRSLGNAADIKRIKAELVPSILSPGEWTSWSTKAREELRTNPDFGMLPDKADHFTVRDQPVSFEEKTYNKFKGDKTFFDRVRTLEEFLAYVDEEGAEGLDSEFFREMFDYFAATIRSSGSSNEYSISSLIVLTDLVTKYPFLQQDLELDFLSAYEQIENVEEVFSRIESTGLKKRFLGHLRAVDNNWAEVYAKLLPYYLSREVLLELERHGKRSIVLDFFSRVFENYRSMRETFVWLVRHCGDDPWFEEMGVTQEKILLSMIHLYDLTFRDIDNRKEVSLNRKINKQIHSFLFRDKRLSRFIDESDEESVSRIFTLIADVKDLDPKINIDLKQRVLNRFPDFHFYGEGEIDQAATRKVLYCTVAMHEAKKAEYNHLQQVEVPQNSKEIEVARSYGDLKENAEYKAAMERQDSLNNRAARLKSELEQAREIDPAEVKNDEISVGTHVRLRDLLEDTELEYTILGPWESDPNRNVISYLSPLGNRLLRSKAGDELDFEINERRYHLRVESIEVSDQL